jgi:hypothetical protein
MIWKSSHPKRSEKDNAGVIKDAKLKSNEDHQHNHHAFMQGITKVGSKRGMHNDSDA